MKKRMFSWILAFTLTVSLCVSMPLPVYALADNWLDGIVSTTTTWDSGGTIGTPEELAQFSYNVNNGKSYLGQTITLTADIDLTGHAWTPIGTDAHSFSGTFDGGGYTVSNMTIESAFDQNGFFGMIIGATIENLTVTGDITVGGQTTGGIAGYAITTASTIEACHSDVTINVITGNVGGILGAANPNMVFIDACFNTGNITSTNNAVGGIGGLLRATITNCYNTGNISGHDHVGGIAGQPDNAYVITNVYSTGTVTGNLNVGGINGYNGAVLSHAVALGQTLTAASSYGRVGNNNTSDDTALYAWSGMLVNGNPVVSADATSKDGASVTDVAVNLASSWSDTWFTDFSTNWEKPAGELPNLKVFTSDSVAVPAYLAVATDATLSAMTISQGTLSPDFDSATTSYTATVAEDVTTMTLTPTVNDGSATVTVNTVSVTSGNPSGDLALSYGDNTITVLVTAEDTTTTKTYTVVVTRPRPLSMEIVGTLTEEDLRTDSGQVRLIFSSATFNMANYNGDHSKITVNNVADLALGNASVDAAYSGLGTAYLLPLTYTGNEFDADISNFNVTVSTEVLDTSNLTSNNLTITAIVEKSAMVNDDIFLGGTYIEVGIDSRGWYGTAENAPAGFHPASTDFLNKLGMVADDDGFGNGNAPVTGDFFLPGSPIEGIVISYTDSSDVVHTAKSLNYPGYPSGLTIETRQEKSMGNLLEGNVIYNLDGDIRLTQRTYFSVSEKEFHIDFSFENISGEALHDIIFYREIDCDQDFDLHGNYTTINRVLSNPIMLEDRTVVSGNEAIVYSLGETTGFPFVYKSSDDRARAAYVPGNVVGTAPSIESSYWKYDGSTMLTEEITADRHIFMTFLMNDLANGETDSATMTASLNANLDEVVVIDDTAPILSNMASSSVSYASANVNFTSDEEGTYYYKVFSSEQDPAGLAASIMADPTGSGSAVAGSNTIALSGLSATTTYYVGVVEKDAAFNTSNALQVSFRTTSKPTPPPADTGVTVIVNGEEQNSGSLATTTNSDGTKDAVVDIDESVMTTRIEAALEDTETEKDRIEVPVAAQDADKLSVELDGDVAKILQDNDFELSIQSEGVTYDIPAKELNLEAALTAMGMSEDLASNLSVEFHIDKVPAAKVQEMTTKAQEKGYGIVVPPVTFTVEVRSKTLSDKSYTISNFNQYVPRTLRIPDGVDPSQITTGIVYNEDGTYSHIPTVIYEVDGVYYAKLNSLTNSEYSVIWNPIEVESVMNHWSKDYVDEMASRLVISDPESFNPTALITRGKFTEYLIKGLGLFRTGVADNELFSDVSGTKDMQEAIAIAVNRGIVKGYEDGSFKPYNAITREEAMMMLANALAYVKIRDVQEGRLDLYADKESVSAWAYAAVQTVVEQGVFNGVTADEIAPQGKFTYAEAATAIYNMLVAAEMINE